MTHIFEHFINKIKLDINPIAFWRQQGAVIAEDCYINPDANLGSEPYLITIGNHVRINRGATLVTHDGGCWVIRRVSDIDNREEIDMFGRIVIGDNVHVGTNAIIMPNVTIGNNCIIGCGAVVTHDVPDNSIVGGVPARIIESIDEYEKKHTDDFLFIKNKSVKEKKRIIMKHFGM